MENGNYAPRIDELSVKVPNPNYLQATVLCEQLRAAGVEHVVISPGSRSTPLARTALLCGEFQSHVVVDERSAGFFALGLAKGNDKPVVLICTSGTAAAHYYPAVIEASQSGYPLIVITADRPRHIRNTGAPQTIDQVALFGRYTRMCIDLSEPTADVLVMKESLAWIKRALQVAQSHPYGPVQINVPMDEPLVPIENAAEECLLTYQNLTLEVAPITPLRQTKVEATGKLLQTLDNSICGLIVCGPDSARNKHERDAIHELSRKLGWPLVADIASGLRFCGEPNMPYYDIFLRHESLARIAPDVVLEFGMTPTSKTLTQYLKRHRTKTIRIQRDTLPHDPDGRAGELVVTDLPGLLGELRRSVKVSRDSLLLDAFWKAVGSVRLLLTKIDIPHESELAYVNAAVGELSDDANLVLASSMSVRYADMIAAPAGRDIHVFAQRGTNGIDGVLSHAAGIAMSSAKPTLLICGDLAFWHDLQGLSLTRHAETLTVLLLNNDGGGIFHFLPIVEYQDSFELIHGTKLEADLSGLALSTGNHIKTVSTLDECRAEVCTGLPHIVEVRSDRTKNHEAHQHFVESLLRELEA